MANNYCWECAKRTLKTEYLEKKGKSFVCPRCGATYDSKMVYICGSSKYDSDFYERIYDEELNKKPAECRVCGSDNYPKCMDACHLFGN